MTDDDIGIGDVMRLNSRKIENRLSRIKHKYIAKPMKDKPIVGGGRINVGRDLNDYISPIILRWFLQLRVSSDNDDVAKALTSVKELVDIVIVSNQPEPGNDALTDDVITQALTSVKELVDIVIVSKQPKLGFSERIKNWLDSQYANEDPTKYEVEEYVTRLIEPADKPEDKRNLKTTRYDKTGGTYEPVHNPSPYQHEWKRVTTQS